MHATPSHGSVGRDNCGRAYNAPNAAQKSSSCSENLSSSDSSCRSQNHEHCGHGTSLGTPRAAQTQMRVMTRPLCRAHSLTFMVVLWTSPSRSRSTPMQTPARATLRWLQHPPTSTRANRYKSRCEFKWNMLHKSKSIKYKFRNIAKIKTEHCCQEGRALSQL
eukprot:Amastigsp_a174380_19.p3 type:complete len:163 gc:universal Amastigsp_a174380_19:3606-4094(+)